MRLRCRCDCASGGRESAASAGPERAPSRSPPKGGRAARLGQAEMAGPWPANSGWGPGFRAGLWKAGRAGSGRPGSRALPCNCRHVGAATVKFSRFSEIKSAVSVPLVGLLLPHGRPLSAAPHPGPLGPFPGSSASRCPPKPFRPPYDGPLKAEALWFVGVVLPHPSLCYLRR